MQAKRKIGLVLDYLELGLALDSLDLGMSLDDFVLRLYGKKTRLLLPYLNSYEMLLFIHDYEKFKKAFFNKFIKDNLYTLVLCLISYLLSWFFLLKFSVAIAGMLASFELNLALIKRYQTVVLVFLFGFHLLLIVIALGVLLLRTLDMRVLFYIRFHERFQLLRHFVSFHFALNMNLMTKYGVRTQMMVQIMRVASMDSFSRWLAYHVEDDLLSGSDYASSFKHSFFDPKLILVIQQGILTGNLNANLDAYLGMSKHSLIAQTQRLSKGFKAVVFAYLVLLMALYYSVLYLPMQVMEGL